MNDCISINHQTGRALIQDERVFRPGNEAFCERLVEHLLADGDVSSVQLALGNNLCQLEFSPGKLCRAEMAERFAKAVRGAMHSNAGPLRRLFTKRRPRWTSLAGFATDGHHSVWEITSSAAGELSLRHRGMRGGRRGVGELRDRLSDSPEVQFCRAHRWSRQIDLIYSADVSDPVHIASTAEAALRRIGDKPARQTGAEQPIMARGARRICYIALGCGSFVLACVGLVVPGVPTVPFVLLTSYCFVRSSATLHGMLLRSNLFGDVLRDWEKWGGMRLQGKLKVIGFTVAVCAITLLLATPPMALVLVVFAIAAGSIYAILRLPSVPNEPPAITDGRPRLALTG